MFSKVAFSKVTRLKSQVSNTQLSMIPSNFKSVNPAYLNVVCFSTAFEKRFLEIELESNAAPVKFAAEKSQVSTLQLENLAIMN